MDKSPSEVGENWTIILVYWGIFHSIVGYFFTFGYISFIGHVENNEASKTLNYSVLICFIVLRWPFCTSLIGSLHRDMQISKILQGWQLDAPLDSGSSTRYCGLILNLETCIITIDTILQKFAYPCATRYADFIRFSGEPIDKRRGLWGGGCMVAKMATSRNWVHITLW